MPWYKSGTVSVAQNSNVVIGAGTAFISNGRVGDAFRGPDGGWYEITNIASDTAMSISPNYQGATSPTGIYALAPMQGYVKDSADALRALVGQFGGVLAVLGSTPTLAGVREALDLESSDGLSEGETNKYFSEARVRSTVLTGMVTTDSEEVASTDTLLTATGKLQAQLSAQSSAALPKSGGTLSGPINDAPPPSIASASTVDIGAATSNIVVISGSAAITGLGVIAAGARRTLRFLGAAVLTHNAASLILPTGANITAAANDTADFLSLGAGNWLCVAYSRSSGRALSKDFAYDRSNILGTVTQSGGVPTGAIIERGSNANGSFVKFADGTLEVSNTRTIFASIYILATAPIYRSDIFLGSDFAYPFIAQPAISVTVTAPPGQLAWLVSQGADSLTKFPAIYLLSYYNPTNITWRINEVAKGRWF